MGGLRRGRLEGGGRSRGKLGRGLGITLTLASTPPFTSLGTAPSLRTLFTLFFTLFFFQYFLIAVMTLLLRYYIYRYRCRLRNVNFKVIINCVFLSVIKTLGSRIFNSSIASRNYLKYYLNPPSSFSSLIKY